MRLLDEVSASLALAFIPLIMYVLALDASTYSGSVALIGDGVVVNQAVAAMRGEHEERLMPAIASILADRGVHVDQLHAVACGAGPGSFTSLRIAASIAKGLSSARQIPLLVAPSTLLVATAAEPTLASGRYVVALDAMRGDFFCQDVDVEADGSIGPGDSWRTSRALLESHAASTGATIIGPLETPKREPHARGFATLIRLGIAQPVEMTTWEPDYGRKAEAQVKWEAAHGRELGTD
jgi:tRNA threonylcarbamoyladenosine biosynthesis protein TsaB